MEDVATTAVTDSEHAQPRSSAATDLAADVADLRGSLQAVQFLITLIIGKMETADLDRFIPAVEGMRDAVKLSSNPDRAAFTETVNNILDLVKTVRDARRRA